MNILYVVPAYGRNYKTQNQVVAAWQAGKDFRIDNLSHPDNGRCVNIGDAQEYGVTHIHVTFNKGKNTVLIPVSDLVGK